MDKTTGENSYGDNELTTNVGTALYVAPELRGQSSGNYNEKVDVCGSILSCSEGLTDKIDVLSWNHLL